MIYHIVLHETWAKFKDKAFYEAESLQTENFIHCSFAEQIEAVLERYYKGADTVLILHIEPKLLTAQLIEEPSTGGEIFPHVYGKINREAIVEIGERKLN